MEGFFFLRCDSTLNHIVFKTNSSERTVTSSTILPVVSYKSFKVTSVSHYLRRYNSSFHYVFTNLAPTDTPIIIDPFL
jgi:hypothetical protein